MVARASKTAGNASQEQTAQWLGRRLSATPPFGPCDGPYPIYAAEHRHSSSGHATIGFSEAPRAL